jgi:hypothetical protein
MEQQCRQPAHCVGSVTGLEPATACHHPEVDATKVSGTALVRPSGYIWGGAALIAVAAWLPLLSDGFSDPGFVVVLFGLLGSLGLGLLLTGAVAQGILVARSNQRDQSPRR